MQAHVRRTLEVDGRAYYRGTCNKWYSWFAYVYDPFVKVLFFILGGGFGAEPQWRESVVEWINPQPNERILDICSGTGTLTIVLGWRLRGTGEVVGIETSPHQLNIASKKRKPDNVCFVRGDAEAIPFPDRHFDKGVICGALHEMPGDVRRRVLGETYRVIRPGGSMVVFEPNEPGRRWKRWLFDFLERFNPEYQTYKDLLRCGLIEEVERAGFEVVRRAITSWEYFQMVLAGK